jgi:hypothetical protein
VKKKKYGNRCRRCSRGCQNDGSICEERGV